MIAYAFSSFALYMYVRNQSTYMHLQEVFSSDNNLLLIADAHATISVVFVGVVACKLVNL